MGMVARKQGNQLARQRILLASVIFSVSSIILHGENDSACD